MTTVKYKISEGSIPSLSVGRIALLVTFKKAKPKSQSLSRSHIRDLAVIFKESDR
jgi:hypothetical protein